MSSAVFNLRTFSLCLRTGLADDLLLSWAEKNISCANAHLLSYSAGEVTKLGNLLPKVHYVTQELASHPFGLLSCGLLSNRGTCGLLELLRCLVLAYHELLATDLCAVRVMLSLLQLCLQVLHGKHGPDKSR